MRSLPPILTLGFALAITTTVAFHAPCGYRDEADLTLDTPAGTYYVVNEECQPDCLFSIWVYEETNGVDGLQRDDCPYGDCTDHPCETDTIIL